MVLDEHPGGFAQLKAEVTVAGPARAACFVPLRALRAAKSSTGHKTDAHGGPSDRACLAVRVCVGHTVTGRDREHRIVGVHTVHCLQLH